jgi:hypothetical protein
MLPEFIKRMLGFADKMEANLSAQAELATAKARITELETGLAALKSSSGTFTVQITDLTAKLETAQNEVNAKGTEVATLTESLAAEKRKTVEVLAAQGIDINSLPSTAPNAAAGGAQVDPIAKLRAQLEASKDPQEKFRLSAQIRELLAKAKK